VPLHYAITTDEGTEVYFQVLLIWALHDSKWAAWLRRWEGREKFQLLPSIEIRSSCPISKISKIIFLMLIAILSSQFHAWFYTTWSKNMAFQEKLSFRITSLSQVLQRVSTQDWLFSTYGLKVKITQQSHGRGNDLSWFTRNSCFALRVKNAKTIQSRQSNTRSTLSRNVNQHSQHGFKPWKLHRLSIITCLQHYAWERSGGKLVATALSAIKSNGWFKNS
jgi:hypothetical protein